MRFWLSYIGSFIVIATTCLLLLWTSTPLFPKDESIITPIPSFITLTNNKEVTLIDLWKPLVERIYGDSGEKPEVTARAALTYDLTTNRVLFEKNSTDRLPMASLTKIMTAIVSLEHARTDDTYVVRGENLVGEDSMGVEPGEIFTLKELLYGLMLRSGNDAAEVLASNYPPGRELFVAAMNEKAVSLGLTDTKFSNPSGLQGDGEQYSTAQNLLVITKYALEQFPDFAEVAATAEHTIEANATHKEYYLENETNLLTTYPGVKGVKTGYTPEAGLCLISYLEYKEHKIIGILLNSENRREEMKELLDYSLKLQQVKPPLHD